MLRAHLETAAAGRVQEIAQELEEANGSYALAVRRRKELYKAVEPVLASREDISISSGDCGNIRDYLEQNFEANAILEQELYRRGYLDCVDLLSELGIL